MILQKNQLAMNDFKTKQYIKPCENLKFFRTALLCSYKTAHVRNAPQLQEFAALSFRAVRIY